MKINSQLLLSILIGILVQSCYPGDGIPIEDIDTSTTLYVAEDFTTPPKSVAIFWEVIKIESQNPANNIQYNNELDSVILNTSLENFINLYGKENVYILSENTELTPSNGIDIPINNIKLSTDPPPNVDVALTSNIILKKEISTIIYPGYPWYGGWGGGWWGGWGGCYYCGYPPVVSYQKYEIGSLILDLIDIRKFINNTIPDSITPSWVSINRGLISSNKALNEERTINAINKSFEQSTYLK